MKRILCFLIALVLVCPAALAEDSELARVTKLAKEKLAIGDEYTDFSAESEEREGHVVWSLRWSGGDGDLYVDMDGEGRIYYYDHSFSASEDPLLHYPALGLDDARLAAEAFLQIAMAEGDGYRIEDSSARVDSGERTLSGVITRNGLDTDATFRMTVASDLSGESRVSYFGRSDSYVKLAEAGEAAPVVLYDEANAGLLDFFELRLVYRADDDGKVARPAYVRVSAPQFVDAETGDVAEWGMNRAYRISNAESMAADAGGGLTEVEMQGVSDYETALSQEELDGIVRALPHMGLDSLPLTSFRLGWSDSDLVAAMEYADDDKTVSVYLNAVTGRLVSVWSTAHSYDATADADVQRAIADEFLAACAPDLAAKMTIEEPNAEDGYARYEYVRMENGIPYPENGAIVEIDAETGYVTYCSITWTDDMEFAGTPTVSLDEARETWLGGLKTELRYVEYNNIQTLAWVWLGDEPRFINAETGEAALEEEPAESAAPDGYADVCGRLAEVGVGFSDGELRPEDAMTVRDLLRLYASLYGYDAVDYGDADLVSCYPMQDLGFTEEQMDESATVLDLAKAVVARAGFDDAAKLPGIFKTDFADDADIPEEDRGYAAIASALKLVSTEEGAFAGSRTLTRGEALIMLDAMLSR